MGVLTAARGRLLQPLPMPAGPAVLDRLPALAAALRGEGPAHLLVPGDDPDTAARLARELAAGTALAAGEDDEDDPTAVVVATSGSTGTAKGVLLPAAALAASGAATRARLAPDGPVHWLLALPAHHVAGLQVLLRSLADGTEPVVLAPPFRADVFTAAVGRMPAGPRWTSLVPTQLRRVLQDAEATAALTGFDAVLVGGAATAPGLLATARAAGVPVVTTYGMSETCGGCVYDGVPLPGVRVDVVPPTTAPDGPGIVAITGPVVARGYRGRPDDPAFGPGDATGRTFTTADLAEPPVPGDPRVRLLGRADDVLVSGGVNVDPLAVEAALAAVPGVAEVLVVGVPDVEWGTAVVAVVVAGTDRAAGPSLAALGEAATRAVGRAAAPAHLVLVDELPLRGPGKPDRAAAAALAAARLER